MKSRLVLPCVAAVLLCTAMVGGVQSEERIFNSQNINVDDLTDQLDPASQQRSIGVARDEPPPTGKAALQITFVTNSSDLTPTARSSLDVVARALQADRLVDFSFIVEGHADPRGRHDSNLRLSQARAESVVDYLSSRHHIERERLKPIGKGDTELANTAEPTAPENRRVTFVTVSE